MAERAYPVGFLWPPEIVPPVCLPFDLGPDTSRPLPQGGCFQIWVHVLDLSKVETMGP